MKTYADLLRGKIFNYEHQAKEYLKNENDSVFWWESNQIWGYTTKELAKEAILKARKVDEKIKQSLISMCKSLRMDENNLKCDILYSNNNKTVAEFIGLNL